MELGLIVELIGTIGFPLVAVICLGWFVYKIYVDQREKNKEDMEQVQARCKEREEKLYAEIKENREVIAQAVATIGLYADRLDTIQHDVNEIKTDIVVITEKLK